MFSQLFSAILKSSPKLKKSIWKKVYQFLARKYQTAEWTFMNYGFQSLDESYKVELRPEDEKDRFFIQLYERVVSVVELSNKNVLEVGSGRGGGSNFIARYYDPAQVTGVDFSIKAVQFCDKNYKTQNLEFKEGDAENLPFKDASFDVVLNVESSHCYANVPQFFQEVKRVLKPGGYFTFADFRDKLPFAELESQIKACGLEIVSETNISKEVLKALDDFNDEKMERFSEMFGSWLNKPISEFAGVKGSAIHTDLSNGETLYYHYLLRKRT